jgi:hypothetical protein
LGNSGNGYRGSNSIDIRSDKMNCNYLKDNRKEIEANKKEISLFESEDTLHSAVILAPVSTSPQKTTEQNTALRTFYTVQESALNFMKFRNIGEFMQGIVCKNIPPL